MNEIGSGFFLQFSDTEIKEVHKFCIANRYDFDRDGIKQAFLDMLRDEESEPEKNSILEALENNPEIITKAGEAAANIFGKFLNRKKPG